jgi:hypothetical protein
MVGPTHRPEDANAAPPERALAEALAGLLYAGERLAALPALIERVEEVARAVGAHAMAAAVLAALEEGLHPDHVYTTAKAARFLGMKASSANKLPHALCPHTGGRWRGVDIMAYRGDLTREEAAAYKEAKRRAVLRHLD